MDSERILRAFRDDDFCFRQSLKILNIFGSEVKEEGLETLLFDILPRFPNLTTIHIPFNRIESLQMIASRIKLRSTDEIMSIPDNSLRKLKLYCNPVLEKIRDDQKEKDALMTILNAFSEISSLGSPCSINGLDVDYLLRINQAGRKFITGGPEGRGEEPSAVDSHRFRNDIPPRLPIKPGIKLELWPNMLKGTCETGMFYLIRNGYILQDIISIRQGDISNNEKEML